MSKLRTIALVAVKELRDNARDRRALSTALLMPLLGPLSLLLVFGIIRDAEHDASEPHVAVVFPERAPTLMAQLRSQGVVLEPTDGANIEERVRAGDPAVALRIPEEYATALRAGHPAPVEIIADPSRQAAATAQRAVTQAIVHYGQQVGALRLVARGINPEIVAAVVPSLVDVGRPQGRAAMLLGILPMFLMVAAFAASTYVAIDVTAGERERGSIEPLLMAPVAPVLLLLGKLVAVIAFGALGVCAAGLSFTIVARVVPFADVGVAVHLDVRTVLLLVALTLPVTLTAAAIQCLVGVLSKSFKTAQAAISLVIILPTVPAMLLSVFPQQPKLWMAAIPTLGEPMLALRLLRGDPVEVLHVLVLVGANAAVAGLLTLVTARLFGPRLLSSS